MSPVPPHPCPLPWGEGALPSVAQDACTPRFVATRSMVLPLPKGEDLGEGALPSVAQDACTPRFVVARSMVLPLPKGEDWGEGAVRSVAGDTCTPRFVVARSIVLPLPTGEGWGEGEGDARPGKGLRHTTRRSRIRQRRRSSASPPQREGHSRSEHSWVRPCSRRKVTAYMR